MAAPPVAVVAIVTVTWNELMPAGTITQFGTEIFPGFELVSAMVVGDVVIWSRPKVTLDWEPGVIEDGPIPQ
jgi:hypothetical protein